ncbi:MAG: hypothetical protein IH593_07395, partial [Bacteroidales bacterium]|nr:hypothetical protein [Bacteroidales bacterium]
QKATDPSQRRTWYNLFRGVVLTDKGLARLEDIWIKGALPGDQKLSEDDLSTLAFNLALKNHHGADRMLKEQR